MRRFWGKDGIYFLFILSALPDGVQGERVRTYEKTNKKSYIRWGDMIVHTKKRFRNRTYGLER